MLSRVTWESKLRQCSWERVGLFIVIVIIIVIIIILTKPMQWRTAAYEHTPHISSTIYSPALPPGWSVDGL